MSAFDPKRTYVSSSAERHSQAGPYVNNLRSGGACALPIFTFFIFQSEAAWLTFLCDWRRRLLLNRKSACVFHIEEPVMRDLGPIDCFHHFGFPYACALAAFPTQPVVAKRAARVSNLVQSIWERRQAVEALRDKELRSKPRLTHCPAYLLFN